MRLLPRTVSGRVVFITGGARGIGLATATDLARRGAQVCIGDLDEELTAKAAAGIGHDVRPFRLDVTDHAGYTAVLDEVERTVGPLDVLVSNAGVMPVGRFVDEDHASILRQFEINVFAVMHGTREAIARMTPRKRGHIVTVASMAGVIPTPGAAAYSASKHAVVGFHEALRWELRGTGVDLTYVNPALVNTELAGGVRRTAASAIVEPQDVAARVVSAIRRPRPAVYAPGFMRPVVALTSATPRAVMDFSMLRTGSDHLLTDSLASAERQAYAARVAASAPGADGRR